MISRIDHDDVKVSSERLRNALPAEPVIAKTMAEDKGWQIIRRGAVIMQFSVAVVDVALDPISHKQALKSEVDARSLNQ